MFDRTEANGRLEAITTMLDEYFNSAPEILLSTARVLENIQMIASGADDALQGSKAAVKQEHIIISCDASIKVNPGGPSSVGVVITLLEGKPMNIFRRTKATTNNQAEYDAVYFGLMSLINLKNNPHCKIEVRSDSKLVVDQLNGDMKCSDERLQEKKQGILELVGTLPVPVEFRWMPRNSTPELRQANFLAQDILGVPRH